MRRCTIDGCVVVNSMGDVRGVGRDSIGAWTEASFLTQDEHREDLIRRGWRCVPARITVTFDPKAEWWSPGKTIGGKSGA